MLENYDNLNFAGKSELDKKLTKSDTELSIIRDDLDEFLFKLFKASKEFLILPSDKILNIIKEFHKIASNRIDENQIEEKINNRIKTAELLYGNKSYILKYGLYYRLKKEIGNEINIIRDFNFLDEV